MMNSEQICQNLLLFYNVTQLASVIIFMNFFSKFSTPPSNPLRVWCSFGNLLTAKNNNSNNNQTLPEL